MRKTYGALLIAIILIITLGRSPAYALDEFRTQYKVKYENLDNSETLVTQEITLTNLKDDVIATNYTLNLKQIQIYDVKASDSLGEMNITQEQKQDTTTLIAIFNENTIGKGRSTTFTISYKTRDIAMEIGEIHTIKIPKVAGLINVKEYDVEVVIPISYGPRIFITPEPKSLKENINSTSYFFDRESLEDGGISASFGKYQVFNYKLTYQLKNDAFFSTIQEITLPPDIPNRQEISHKQINPEPKKVYQDKDGNLIAQYTVNAKSYLEVELIGTVRVLGRQINPELGGNFIEIEHELIQDYTKEDKYWEISSAEVQTLKNKLYDKNVNVTQNAKNIYDYLTNELNYDHTVIEKDFVERGGALKALKKEVPAACMEFTDLFITLSRAMGIPARELNGYAINVYDKTTLPLSIKFNSGDLLHSWPEFYDPNFGWVPIDPTWGSTSKLDFFSKLDNSHFVFSIKGHDSEYPLPAGLFRTDDAKQLVSVEVSEIDSEADFNHFVGLYKKVNLNPYMWITGKKKYLAKNLGGTYVYNLAGKTLLPFEVKKLFLEKDLDILRFEDTHGKLHSQSISLLNKNPAKRIINPFFVVFSLLLGLLLCSLLYYFLILKGYLQKLRDLRSRHRRARDQKHSQNS